jgi:hypothetical protein
VIDHFCMSSEARKSLIRKKLEWISNESNAHAWISWSMKLRKTGEARKKRDQNMKIIKNRANKDPAWGLYKEEMQNKKELKEWIKKAESSTEWDVKGILVKKGLKVMGQSKVHDIFIAEYQRKECNTQPSPQQKSVEEAVRKEARRLGNGKGKMPKVLLQELKKALKRANQNGSPGEDMWTIKLIVKGGEVLLRAILTLMNKLTEAAVWPKWFQIYQSTREMTPKSQTITGE